jgi:hypothetical protein
LQTLDQPLTYIVVPVPHNEARLIDLLGSLPREPRQR